MATIRILPEILSNQIAAGEVVERPVSIVKELVENCIDAKATRIIVEIQGGGKSLIRVSDNGIGLSRDDALLAIERYATSKIYDKKDLFSISTMGFRGEALPSIASVSKFSLTTRTKGSDIGTRLDIIGGKLVSVNDAGAPVGTMVEVKSLFFNTPVRKKFLKSDQTEIGHISDALSGIALGHSHIQFKLIVNKKVLRHYPASADLMGRAIAVLGKEVAGKVYPIEYRSQELALSGYCVNPMISRSTSSRIFLFVNKRLIHDRGLVSAIFQGYRGRIMKGRFPLVVIFVDIAFDRVDVNVHPSKREVRFTEHQRVYQAVSLSVAQALTQAQDHQDQYSDTRVVQSTEPVEEPLPPYKATPEEGPVSEPNRLVLSDQKAEQTVFEWRAALPSTKASDLQGSSGAHREAESADVLQTKTLQGENIEKSAPAPEGEFHGKSEPSSPIAQYDSSQTPDSSFRPGYLKIIGQVMGTYIVIERDDQLVLVDQHAAHERIVYESYLRRQGAMATISQQLVVPETLELNHREANVLMEILEELRSLGIVIEPFGGTTFVVKAVPSLVDEKQIRPVIHQIVESIVDTGNKKTKTGWHDNALITMACHGAIRANKPMTTLEMEQLINDLETCENPMHCPHGRPTQITLSQAELEKLFKRVV